MLSSRRRQPLTVTFHPRAQKYLEQHPAIRARFWEAVWSLDQYPYRTHALGRGLKGLDSLEFKTQAGVAYRGVLRVSRRDWDLLFPRQRAPRGVLPTCSATTVHLGLAPSH